MKPSYWFIFRGCVNSNKWNGLILFRIGVELNGIATCDRGLKFVTNDWAHPFLDLLNSDNTEDLWEIRSK